MTFSAHTKLLYKCLAIYTVPALPSPIYPIIAKSFIDIGLLCLNEDFRLILLLICGMIFVMLLKGWIILFWAKLIVSFSIYFYRPSYSCSEKSFYFLKNDIFEDSLEFWLIDVFVEIVELMLSLLNYFVNLLWFKWFSLCFLILDWAMAPCGKSSTLLGLLSS